MTFPPFKLREKQVLISFHVEFRVYNGKEIFFERLHKQRWCWECINEEKKSVKE